MSSSLKLVVTAGTSHLTSGIHAGFQSQSGSRRSTDSLSPGQASDWPRPAIQNEQVGTHSATDIAHSHAYFFCQQAHVWHKLLAFLASTSLLQSADDNSQTETQG